MKISYRVSYLGLFLFQILSSILIIKNLDFLGIIPVFLLKTEILVVDASEGNLYDIKKESPSVRWIYFHNKKNKKIKTPGQRNLGLKKAKGNIITFIYTYSNDKKY